MADVCIGYYVHHHGTGHMRRALAVIAHIPHRVILFASAEAPTKLPSNVTFVKLDDDAIEGFEQPSNSLLMYSPYSPSILKRYDQILQAIIAFGIKTMYVDVSLEVALFCKTLGLTVGHNVMIGERDDSRHDFLYSLCDFYLSDDTPLLSSASRRHAITNLTQLGGISRYPVAQPRPLQSIKNVLVTVSPKSQVSLIEDVQNAARHYPAIEWHVIGQAGTVSDTPNLVIHGAVDDPKTYYEQADVVIGAGGHNTIMDVASFGKPFVCIPEARPYNEQVSAANALRDNGLAVVKDGWPKADEWDEIFSQLRSVDIQAFQSIVDDNAAGKAAAIISEYV